MPPAPPADPDPTPICWPARLTSTPGAGAARIRLCTASRTWSATVRPKRAIHTSGIAPGLRICSNLTGTTWFTVQDRPGLVNRCRVIVPGLLMAIVFLLAPAPISSAKSPEPSRPSEGAMPRSRSVPRIRSPPTTYCIAVTTTVAVRQMKSSSVSAPHDVSDPFL